jgi:hypothetical protein
MMTNYISFAALAACSIAFVGCQSTAQIRIENVSKHHLTKVRIMGQPFGEIPSGDITDFKPVNLRGRYAAMKFTADGKYMTSQTLNFGSKKFTYQLDIKDFEKGHPTIKLIQENE